MINICYRGTAVLAKNCKNNFVLFFRGKHCENPLEKSFRAASL